MGSRDVASRFLWSVSPPVCFGEEVIATDVDHFLSTFVVDCLVLFVLKERALFPCVTMFFLVKGALREMPVLASLFLLKLPFSIRNKVVGLAFLKDSSSFVCHLYQWTLGEVVATGRCAFHRLFYLALDHA